MNPEHIFYGTIPKAGPWSADILGKTYGFSVLIGPENIGFIRYIGPQGWDYIAHYFDTRKEIEELLKIFPAPDSKFVPITDSEIQQVANAKRDLAEDEWQSRYPRCS